MTIADSAGTSRLMRLAQKEAKDTLPLRCTSRIRFLLMRKPFGLTDPLGLYVTVFCTIGTLSVLYCLLPFGRNLGRYRYSVASVKAEGEAYAVTLERERRVPRMHGGPGMLECHPVP